MKRLANFTIIIPTYRRPILLQKAIKSGLTQNYSEIEVLVLDNASGDETAEVVHQLQKEDSRIKYICHEKNIGMLGQYQYGIDHVETEFFSFLSDDDLLLPSFCEVSLKGLEQFSNCCFFASSTIIYSKEKGIIRIPMNHWTSLGKYEPDTGPYEMVGKYPVPTTIAFRKTYVSQVFIDKENPLAWDCDLLLQLSCRFPFAISNEITGIFFSHNQSLTTSMVYQDVTDSIHRIIKRVPFFEAKNPALLKDLLTSDLVNLSKSYAINFGKKGETKAVYRVAKDVKALKPMGLNSYFLFTCLIGLTLFSFLRIPLALLLKIRSRKRKKTFQEYERFVDAIS